MNRLLHIPFVAVGLLVLAGCVTNRAGHAPAPRPETTTARPLTSPPETAPPPVTEHLDTFVGRDGRTPIRVIRGTNGFFFTAGMSVNADGAPNAYHPDRKSGLDFLANAGRAGNWWGLATDNNKPSGNPLVQTEGEFKGYYVSHTALCSGSKPDADITKYVDSRQVPFVVLPPQLLGPGMAQLGDLAVVYNTYNGALEYAIVADIGPGDGIGEGSIALAADLGIDTGLRNHTAGQEGGVVYLVFPGTAAQPAWPITRDDIRAKAAAAFTAWGGLDQLKSIAGR